MIYKVRTPPRMTGYLKGDVAKLYDYLKTMNAYLQSMFENIADENIKSISASKINAGAAGTGSLTLISEDGSKVIIEPSGTSMNVEIINSDGSQYVKMQDNNIDIVCKSIKADVYEGLSNE